MSLQVSILTDGGEAWDSFLGDCRGSTFFQRHDWLHVVREAYGGHPFHLAAQDSDRLVAVLPLMLRRLVGWGRVLQSVPLADEGGICGGDQAAQTALLETAAELGTKARARFIELRQREPVAGDLPCDRSRVTLVKRLPGEQEAMWQALPAKTRNQVRQACKHGLEVDRGGRECLASFYYIYARNTRDLGSPMHSLRFFEVLLRRFPDETRIVLVKADGQPIGGALAVLMGDTIMVPWAASLREHFRLRPNTLLYWRLLEWAVERGCGYFDFGRSLKDSGPYRFKRQWGTEDVQLHYTYVPLSGQPDLGEKRDSFAYRAFSTLWRGVPMPLATRVGPRIFARLPI